MMTSDPERVELGRRILCTLAGVKPAGRSRRKKAVPDSQMSFFDLAVAA
jgi:hypothetical protein